MGQFDFDKINGNLKVRNKRPGDRFKPLGLKGTQKLKDFLLMRRFLFILETKRLY